MQCPICSNETTQYVDISNIASSLHVPLFDLCAYWHHSPGVCTACIDELDMKTDEVFQQILNGTHRPALQEIPYVLSLSERETPFWFHEDDHIRTWFRGEVRKKVKALAYEYNHHFWSIADANRVLLDFGEMPIGTH